VKNFELVIFDCDGTISDSEYLNCLASSSVLNEAGFPEYTFDLIFNDFVGLTLSEMHKRIEQETGRKIPSDIIERFIARVESLAPQYFKIVDGAPEAVKWASARSKICVASNGERSLVVGSVKSAGLSDLLPDAHIFTSAMVKKGKPAPDLFLYAAEKLGARPNQCLVIEDTAIGVQAGIAAGMTVIGITSAHGHNPDYALKLEKAGAHRIMHHWKDFSKIVSEFKKAA
jgi:HAD superfamily hydrolase (TIGR01509 family)